MLRFGSIRTKVCLLLLFVTLVASQNYEYDGDEDHENISEGDGEHYEHPDYSKYYSVDSSAPLVNQGTNAPSNGFIAPHEFDSFFGPSPIAFGASNTQQIKQQPFIPPPQPQSANIFSNPTEKTQPFQKDFFEESQRKQAAENQPENNDEAPKYISYNHLPQKLRFEDEESASSHQADEVEEVEPRENQEEDKEIDEVENHNYEKPSKVKELPEYPSAEGWKPISPTTPSPYQKYSFQPVNKQPKYLDSLITTIAPFNPNYKKAAPVFETQSSDQVQQKTKNCKKIKKPINKEDSMNCFVCEDPADKSKFTQCSYNSEPKPLNYYQGQSERYSTPANGEDGFRYKRYSDAEENDDTDPYEYVKRRSQQQHSDEDKEKDFSKYFQYNPDFESESESYSEKQSEEIKKNPKNCKKVDKDGMTCTICKDSETGGNYEQCSYTSEPKEKKYAYVTNKKYDSNDDEQPEEEESKTVEHKTEKAPVKKYGSKLQKNTEPLEEHDSNVKQNKRPQRQNRFSKRRNEETRDNVKDDDHRENNKYSVPKHFEENTENQKQNSKPEFKGFDEDYHSKLYPESQESKQEEQIEYTPTKTKHDVEEVLAQFTKKDRSNCKKAQKKGMTCYLCVDEKNISHEECMYISEPQSSHKAYHEVQKLNKPRNSDGDQSESRRSTRTTPAPTTTKSTIKRRRVVKKVTTQKPTLESAASQKQNSYIKYKRQAQKDEPTEVGLETQRVYSEQLGLSLPKYMVEKTDYEKDFDASSSF